MDIPPELVILSTLKVGVVYKMEAPEIIDTTEPHFFIVVGIYNDNNYMLLSTTQRDKKISYIQKKGYDLKTLVRIEPNYNNGLTADSYFNCNDSYIITKEHLIEKVKNGKLIPKGNISEDEYNILVHSINLSDVNDIPKFLLKYD